MTKDEALKLALEALQNPWKAGPDGVADAITTIKEALAQPEQKSVAMADYMALTEKYVALKATQPEQEQFALKHRIAELEGAVIGLQAHRTWVGLTEDEAFTCQGRDYFETYKAIEAKLKEKNT